MTWSQRGGALMMIAQVPTAALILLVAGCASEPLDSHETAQYQLWQSDYEYCQYLAKRALPDGMASSSFNNAAHGPDYLYRHIGNRIRIADAEDPEALLEVLRLEVASDCMRQRGWPDADPDGWKHIDQ